MKNYGITIIISCKDLTGGNKQIIRSTLHIIHSTMHTCLDSGPNLELATCGVRGFGGRVITIENGLYRDALRAG